MFNGGRGASKTPALVRGMGGGGLSGPHMNDRRNGERLQGETRKKMKLANYEISAAPTPGQYSLSLWLCTAGTLMLTISMMAISYTICSTAILTD